ncbi:MAG: vWA domain-containing protein [Planctomycetota bacterium]
MTTNSAAHPEAGPEAPVNAGTRSPQDQPRQPRARSLLLRLSIGGLAISLLVHLGVLIAAALLSLGGGGTGGPTQTPAEVVEFAVMPESDFEAIEPAQVELSTPEVTSLLDALPIESELSELSIEPLTTIELPADVSLGTGAGSVDAVPESSSGAAGAASFFGIEARGTRFAYIVDISGSMAQDNRIDAMLAELRRSVTELSEHVSFYIVFYSNEAYPLGGRTEWTDATNSGKRWARDELRSQSSLGQTKPVPGFELVSRIRPRADAIYFMTDGEFDEADVDTIIAMNRSRRTPIHCITFVTDAARDRMERIAAATGGSYTHVESVGP